MCASRFFVAALAFVLLANGPSHAAEFATAGATVTVHGDAPIMGPLPDRSQQASSLPFSLGVSYNLGGNSSGMTTSAKATADSNTIKSILEANGGGGALGFSLGPDPTGTATVSLSASAVLPVYETIVTKHEFDSESFQPPFPSTHEVSWDFAESPLPSSADGATIKDYSLTFRPPNPSFGSASGHITQTITWSVGPPQGSSANPFVPSAVSSAQQDFSEPALCDAALRYQAPVVDAALRSGFELAGADLNPFTSFCFPDVPAGVNNQFILSVAGVDVGGLAGTTVDLRQFKPEGVRDFAVRGDLSAFLLPGRGGAPPKLTFGLAFAQPGVGAFRLTPVPEPASGWLALAGVVVLAVARRPKRVRGQGVRFRSWAAVLLACTLPSATSVQAKPHSKLTFLPNSPAGVDKSWAIGVDDSGTKVAGNIVLASGESEAAYWTVGDAAPVPLGFMGGTRKMSRATAISRSGEVIVGSGVTTFLSKWGYYDCLEGFRWTASQGFQGLGQVVHDDGNSGETRAWDISGDGKTIVGDRDDPGPVPVRWSNLQPTFLGTDFGYAAAVSADGLHIVGTLTDSAGISHPAIWDGLVPRPLPDELGAPIDISGDGSIVLGTNAIWSEGGGTSALGNLFWAAQLADDGTLIVGRRGGGAFDPVIGELRAGEWRPSRGAQDLATVLIHDYGVGSQLADWKLAYADAVNGMGNAIVGSAFSPDDSRQVAYVVQLVDPLAGDANFDDRVDLLDFGTLSDHFGSGHWRDEGDFNRDFAVDLSDFGILKANFGTRAEAVPEPAGLVLAGSALIWMGAWVAKGRRHSSRLPDPE